MKLKIVACGVFEPDLRRLAADAAAHAVNELDIEVLDAGLHARPAELRLRAQDAIDRASREGGFDAIVLAYGLCGRGISGLVSRDIPLVVPRVHDCISLFLGSGAEYRRQFSKHPGTFYMTAGWFEKKVHPKQQQERVERAARRPRAHAKFREYADKYGADNAEFIVGFLESWRRNYTRAAFIDLGFGDREKYERYTRNLADAAGWTYERLEGSTAILDAMLSGDWSAAQFLTVPPNHRIATTGRDDLIECVPLARMVERDGAASREPTRRVAEPTRRVVEPTGPHAGERQQPTVGLGIDAGGTYTDAVLYDFRRDAVVGKAKALTTPWDYTIGIGKAIQQLDSRHFAKVNLVALSTTLATNAIVEGRGGKVGLIIMPHHPDAADGIPTHPTRIVKGRIDITGEEREAQDAAELAETVRSLAEDEHVDAIAVSGFGGTMNPAHEIRIRDMIRDGWDIPVVCGHELSANLNFVTRANTAVLNARLLPTIGALLRSVRQSLGDFGIRATLVVVKGDGTLVSERIARERPIETILSGPAASATGARFLTGRKDAIAIDVGGTTTDTALVEDGRVAVHPQGATVGEWKTCVAAVDMLTAGLGGDSLLRLDHDLNVVVGPQRVVPLAYLASQHEDVLAALGRTEEISRNQMTRTSILDFFALSDERPADRLTDAEREIVDALRGGPCSRLELAERLSYIDPSLLRTDRLERSGVVRCSALTPTDMLHTTGEFTAWHVEAARAGMRVFAQIMQTTLDDAAERIRHCIVRRLATEIMRKELWARVGGEPFADCRTCDALLDNLFDREGREKFEFGFRVRRPIVAIGAPVRPFMPAVADLLQTELIIPEHAAVANAVGAITSEVVIREAIRIRPDELGNYVLHSSVEKREFDRLDAAQRYAEHELVRILREKALHFGTDEAEVTVEIREREGNLAGGERVFLELIIEGTVAGRPSLSAEEELAAG